MGRLGNVTYFVLHAARQCGKTTAMMELARELTTSGPYVAVTLSMEVGAPFSGDPGLCESAILDDWRDRISSRLSQEFLDSLAERLRERRVRKVIEPILAGTSLDDVPPDLCLRSGQTVLGIELKAWREGASDPLNDGLEQLDGPFS